MGCSFKISLNSVSVLLLKRKLIWSYGKLVSSIEDEYNEMLFLKIFISISLLMSFPECILFSSFYFTLGAGSHFTPFRKSSLVSTLGLTMALLILFMHQVLNKYSNGIITFNNYHEERGHHFRNMENKFQRS